MAVKWHLYMPVPRDRRTSFTSSPTIPKTSRSLSVIAGVISVACMGIVHFDGAILKRCQTMHSKLLPGAYIAAEVFPSLSLCGFALTCHPAGKQAQHVTLGMW